MLSSVHDQTPAWTYPSLTETTCTACVALPPLHRMVHVLSSPIIECSTMYNGLLGEGVCVCTGDLESVARCHMICVIA